MMDNGIGMFIGALIVLMAFMLLNICKVGVFGMLESDHELTPQVETTILNGDTVSVKWIYKVD